MPELVHAVQEFDSMDVVVKSNGSALIEAMS